MKYIIQLYEGEINGHGEKEGLPTQYQHEFEQEMFQNTPLIQSERPRVRLSMTEQRMWMR